MLHILAEVFHDTVWILARDVSGGETHQHPGGAILVRPSVGLNCGKDPGAELSLSSPGDAGKGEEVGHLCLLHARENNPGQHVLGTVWPSWG